MKTDLIFSGRNYRFISVGNDNSRVKPCKEAVMVEGSPWTNSSHGPTGPLPYGRHDGRTQMTIDPSRILTATNGVIALPEGGEVRTFTPPLQGFDPLKASDRELRVHGFPERPAEPERLTEWEKVFANPSEFIEPTFRKLEDERPERAERATLTPPSNLYWAGWNSAITTPDRVKAVWGDWTTPTLSTPPPVPIFYYVLNLFIGVDCNPFALGPSLLQVGCRCELLRRPLEKQVFTPYWMSDRGDKYELLRLQVRAGDRFGCVIWIDHRRPSNALIVANNFTTRQAVIFVYEPTDPALFGRASQGQWILERPVDVIFNPLPFPRYGMVDWQSLKGATQNDVPLAPEGLEYTMISGTGTTLSEATKISSTVYRTTYTGP